MKKSQQTVGAIVRRARGAASLRQFAQLVGVSHVQIRNWETGAQRPPVETLARLAASKSAKVRAMVSLLLIPYRSELDRIEAILNAKG